MTDGQDVDSLALAPGATGQSTLADAIDLDETIFESVLESDHINPPNEPIAQSAVVDSVTHVEESESLYDDKMPSVYAAESSERQEEGTLRQDILRSNEHLLQSAVPVHTGYVYSPVMMLHEHPATSSNSFGDDDDDDDDDDSAHPEQPERIARIHLVLARSGCLSRMKRIPIREITKGEVMLVHDSGMWDGLERTALFSAETLAMQTRILDPMSSLYINGESARCARWSCGGVVEMCDAVASGKVRNGFAIVRPPGHHAEPTASMGFCFYNNVAVATAYLRERYGNRQDGTRCGRILILDWDVHHGNGTQKAFWDDENVLFISIHRHEDGRFYPPGPDGNAYQIGEGRGKGRNVNIPWSSRGMGDGEYLSAFRRIVMPIATEFSPDFVIISAGFDAARGDQLGGCDVTPAGYAHMAYELGRLANGRLVAALEGGYNIDAIAASALSVTKVLLGEAPIPFRPGEIACRRDAADTLRMVEHVQSDYWTCMQKTERGPLVVEEEGLQISSLSSLIAAHRMAMLSTKYGLTNVSISQWHDGQCLCSSDIFTAPDKTLILFAHDMGNLRIELPWTLDIDIQRESMYVVDASSKVVEWAKSNNALLIDICTNVEVPLQTRVATTSEKIHDAERRRNVDNLLLHVWDNFVNLTLPNGTRKNVVLIGLGSACDSIVQLIEKRKVKDRVCAVAQFPYQGGIPATQRDSVKRMWYFKNSRIYLPNDHIIFRDEDDISTIKRFGTIVRSKESRALQVLRHEFDDMTSFVQQATSAKRKANSKRDEQETNALVMGQDRAVTMVID